MVSQVIPNPRGYTLAPETRVVVNSGSDYVCEECSARIPGGVLPDYHLRKGTKYTDIHDEYHRRVERMCGIEDED